ncbi:FixH family protein [Sediminicola arcticus]|jgi:nitrogen fixation protein FixH|uniref:FixH family protein n=1 Tax=Sediminicola arcticus TaxID=1574308 RepID=A0ABV2SVV4_9FLAO
MKINWGTGIVLAFIAFISFILFFVVRMTMDSNSNHDLVTEGYYKEELNFQKKMDAERNANNLSTKIRIEKTTYGWDILFPENMEAQKIKGNVSLYRPSNKNLDFDVPISTSNSHMLIPNKRLLDGRWDITIALEYDNQSYLHRESLTYIKN